MEYVKKPKRRKVEKVKCRVCIKHLVLYCDHESIDTHTKAFVPFSIRIEFNRIEKLHFYLKITYWQYYLDFECDFVGFPVLRKMHFVHEHHSTCNLRHFHSIEQLPNPPIEHRIISLFI